MLRIKIDGNWTAKDFINFYQSIHTLYSILAVIAIEVESADEMERYYLEYLDFYPYKNIQRRMEFFLRNQRTFGIPTPHIPLTQFRDADDLLDLSEQLHVRRCTYASPGITDFTGLGTALGHLKDFVLQCKKSREQEPERLAKVRILQQQEDSLKLDNIAKTIDLLERVGYSKAERRQILADAIPAVRKLERLAVQGKITHAENIDNDGGGSDDLRQDE